MLYDKENSASYKNLLELEAFSERSDNLYSYFDLFISMLDDEKYAIRVRGFRLICKQSKWDYENKINKNIDKILLILDDEKPTAVGQALQFLGHSLVPYKKELGCKIKQAALSIDCTRFKADTMRPLIEKEVQKLVKMCDY